MSSHKRKVDTALESPSLGDCFARFYESVMVKLAYHWAFYTSDPYVWTERKTYTAGPFRVIQQPAKNMEENYRFVLLVQPYEDGSKTRVRSWCLSEYVECMTHLQSIQTNLLRSYNKVLELTDNRWFTPCDGTFEKVSSIESMEKATIAKSIAMRAMNSGWLRRGAVGEEVMLMPVP